MHGRTAAAIPGVSAGIRRLARSMPSSLSSAGSDSLSEGPPLPTPRTFATEDLLDDASSKTPRGLWTGWEPTRSAGVLADTRFDESYRARAGSDKEPTRGHRMLSPRLWNANHAKDARGLDREPPLLRTGQSVERTSRSSASARAACLARPLATCWLAVMASWYSPSVRARVGAVAAQATNARASRGSRRGR